MWPFSSSVETQRLRLLKQCRSGPLHDFYSHPFPNDATPIQHISFAVLDLETTGLDLKKDHVISIGLIEINNMGIQLDTAWHQIIKTRHDIPEDSAIIHQITDDQVVSGIELQTAIETLLLRCQKRVLIAHHASIELGFINKICMKLYNENFIIPTIDTVYLARRQLRLQQEHYPAETLRLFNLRKRYGLPAYKAHNALSDALSTAELFLALVNDLYPGLDCKLKDLLTHHRK